MHTPANEKRITFSQLRETLQAWADALTAHPKQKIEVGVNSEVFQFGIDNPLLETRLRKLIEAAEIPLPRSSARGTLRMTDSNITLPALARLKSTIEADTAAIVQGKQKIAEGLNSLTTAPVEMSVQELQSFITGAAHDSSLPDKTKDHMGVGEEKSNPRRGLSVFLSGTTLPHR